MRPRLGSSLPRAERFFLDCSRSRNQPTEIRRSNEALILWRSLESQGESGTVSSPVTEQNWPIALSRNHSISLLLCTGHRIQRGPLVLSPAGASAIAKRSNFSAERFPLAGNVPRNFHRPTTLPFHARNLAADHRERRQQPVVSGCCRSRFRVSPSDVFSVVCSLLSRMSVSVKCGPIECGRIRSAGSLSRDGISLRIGAWPWGTRRPMCEALAVIFG